MQVRRTLLPDVLVIEPDVFADDRGFLFESFNARSFAELGIACDFVQDNHSRSVRGVLRGLHYQIVRPQAKLVRCVSGEVLDIAVDLRRSSPSFGKWTSFLLSESNRQIAWIPAGFAHGFVVKSEFADVIYKVSDFYAPEFDRCIAWNDPDLAIDWELTQQPILSAKDRAGRAFQESDTYP